MVKRTLSVKVRGRSMLNRMAFAVLAVVAAKVSPVQSAQVSRDCLADLIVVRAHVIRYDNERTAVQQIDHLYCGAIPKGMDTFTEYCLLPQDGGHSAGRPVFPPLDIGEQGLWLLRVSKDGSRLTRKSYAELGVLWPVRNHHARFREVMALAEAIESAWLATSDLERSQILLKHAMSEIPEVSVGAIEILKLCGPDALIKLVATADVTALPVQTQVKLDEVMLDVNAVEWRDSQKRHSLMQHWKAICQEDEAHASVILNRLGQAIQRQQIAPELFLDLVQRILDSDATTVGTKQIAMGLWRYVVNDEDVGRRVVDGIVSTLREPAAKPLHSVAVSVLKQRKSVSENQLRDLVVLRDLFTVASTQPDHDASEVSIAKALQDIVGRLSRDQ